MHIVDQIKAAGITKVDAGYRIFEFKFREGIEVNNESCWGHADFDLGLIEVDPTLNHESAKEVILHEITHVMLELVGFGGEGDDQLITNVTNECLTTAVSRGSLLFARLNPELFRLLLG